MGCLICPEDARTKCGRPEHSGTVRLAIRVPATLANLKDVGRPGGRQSKDARCCVKSFPPAKIRNVALVGHGGAGKTTLTESLLHCAGVINRKGRVEDGTTTTD